MRGVHCKDGSWGHCRGQRFGSWCGLRLGGNGDGKSQGFKRLVMILSGCKALQDSYKWLRYQQQSKVASYLTLRVRSEGGIHLEPRTHTHTLSLSLSLRTARQE